MRMQICPRTNEKLYLKSHGSGDGVPLHPRHEDPEAEFSTSPDGEAKPITGQELCISLDKQVLYTGKIYSK